MFQQAKAFASKFPVFTGLQTKWRDLHYSNRMVGTPFGIWDKQTNRLTPYRAIVPNLVLIGAQKCGTTSLAYNLNSHPDIHLSQPIKEPGFFIFDEWAKAYWASRNRPFKSIRELVRNGMLNGFSAQPFFLDASTHYTFADRASRYGIPNKLKKAKARILYIIRNPFSRIISAYYHSRQHEGIKEPMNERLVTDQSLVQTSLYAEQLSHYLAAIPTTNIHVVVFEEFVADPTTELTRIWNFLGLSPIDYPDPFKAWNPTELKKTEKFSSETFHRLLPLVQSDVAELESVLGRDLAWDLSEQAWCD